MGLGNEIFEWRKQMVEQLLLKGRDITAIEKQVSDAELLIFGAYDVDVNIKCPLKFTPELKAILLDFSKKNGCFVAVSAQS